MALSLWGLCHQRAHGGPAQWLQTGKHRQVWIIPYTPSGPKAEAVQSGAASGSVYTDPSSQRSLPSGPGPQASEAPRLVRFYSYTSLSWALVPRHLLLRVPLTTICLGCHGLPHAQEQGPGSPEADSPTGRTRKTYHCLLHDNGSCPHPPPLGSPSERPVFPGPLEWRGGQ